jgi:1-pyrroline-5-carboxylate dehydrogenase
MLIEELSKVKLGGPKDFEAFMGPVIHQASFNKIKRYIEEARRDAEIVFGGKCDDSAGYFVEPTVIKTTDLAFKSMREEIFGPVLTVYVYSANHYESYLSECSRAVKYGLTGAIFARDRQIINNSTQILRHSAGNFYINDKCTGAVVGQQPFGGARLSGTNDKAGSMFNLLRWVSPRLIKENFVSPLHWSYPSNH